MRHSQSLHALPSGQHGRPPERLASFADRLARTVSVARALTVAQRTVELTGLEDGIGILCAQTLDLPPEEARTMVPVLAELLAQLDALSLALRGTQAPAA